MLDIIPGKYLTLLLEELHFLFYFHNGWI